MYYATARPVKPQPCFDIAGADILSLSAMPDDLLQVKKDVFFGLLDAAGRVFVLIEYGEDVLIGNRGFLPEEREKGLVLVFNRRMQFGWSDDSLTATLVFGTLAEKCVIPSGRIRAVFSPELNTQLSIGPSENAAPKGEQKAKPAEADGKVVRVDFQKRK